MLCCSAISTAHRLLNNKRQYQVEAKCFDILVLNSGAVSREPLWDDEEDPPGLVIEIVAGEEDAAPE